MSAESILTKLVQSGMSVAGACGMYGNIMAESSGKSNIAQRGMTSLTDVEYTAQANRGTIDFANDGVGYGLCQWTFYTRKQALLDYAKANNASVGSEEIQLNFMIKELQEDYPEVWTFLCATSSVYDAADKVCRLYERPAVNNVQTRADYGTKAYNTYATQLKAVTADTATINYPTIKAGSSDAEAYYLAMLLKQKGIEVIWQGLTAAIMEFQKLNGLDADGICGNKTWSALTK